MYRYSTATLNFKIISVIDFDNIADVWVTLTNDYSIKKTWKLSKTEVTTDKTESKISLKLSQSDTALFKEGIVEVQLRIIDKTENVYTSSIKKIEIQRVLEEGVMSVPTSP